LEKQEIFYFIFGAAAAAAVKLNDDINKNVP